MNTEKYHWKISLKKINIKKRMLNIIAEFIKIIGSFFYIIACL